MGENGLTLNKVGSTEFYTCDKITNLGFASHFFSTKIGGVSEGFYESLNLGIYTDDLSENIDDNFNRIFKASNMETEKITYLLQKHGSEFHSVDSGNYRETCGKDGDAIITNTSGIAIGVFTADCVPIILVDSVKKVVAVVHAGWKGTYLNIVKKVFEYMKKSMGCSESNVIAVLGPSIGPCCFEVGSDVADKFTFVNKDNDSYYVDLWKENAKQIEDCGVRKDNIIGSGLCTMCEKDKFFSYRRDNGKTGRLGTFIQII
jgi:polyphenol oxidase